MNKHTITIVVAAGVPLVLSAIVLGGYRYAHGVKSLSTSQPLLPKAAVASTSPLAVSEPSATAQIDFQFAADFSDDRVLMGYSHDVFVGKVMKQIGHKERGIGPETQFAVQVISNIKGNLQGTVTVDQQGGYENGTLYQVEDGAPLLRPGATYLIATRYNPQDDWYTMNPSRAGSQFIIDASNLTVSQLQTLAANDLRVRELAAAYPNEVLPEADIVHNNTLNSYQSLHPGLASSSNVMVAGKSIVQ